eukprot:CAMPEP_0119084526 /NCGR_PEP_ID=MMETSP1178-20130426/129989_1 /TAXON_ID=33656 /ORGANISM="unid sp, Strain CCMP2000" /LENGTH=142 /DNA_ID=CAMNT_0007067495 /DNA_START=12 /DNA_END=437 /DNA_ORIENTATION=-
MLIFHCIIAAAHELHCYSENHSLTVARSSGCGSDRWLDSLVAKRHFFEQGGQQRRLAYFNIGANKGFNIAILLQRLSGANFTSMDWANSMHTYFKEKKIPSRHHQRNLCGLCHVCTQQVKQSATDVELELHAFEMTAQNSDW